MSSRMKDGSSVQPLKKHIPAESGILPGERSAGGNRHADPSDPPR